MYTVMAAGPSQDHGTQLSASQSAASAQEPRSQKREDLLKASDICRPVISKAVQAAW